MQTERRSVGALLPFALFGAASQLVGSQLVQICLVSNSLNTDTRYIASSRVVEPNKSASRCTRDSALRSTACASSNCAHLVKDGVRHHWTTRCCQIVAFCELAESVRDDRGQVGHGTHTHARTFIVWLCGVTNSSAFETGACESFRCGPLRRFVSHSAKHLNSPLRASSHGNSQFGSS